MGAQRREGISRRRFLELAAAAGLGIVADPAQLLAQYGYLDPVAVPNPLAGYPVRGWERVYRDIFRTDGSFVFLCCPNDTHNCLLRAFVKNDVVVRIEPTRAAGRRKICTATAPRIAGIRVVAKKGSYWHAGFTGTGGSTALFCGKASRSGWTVVFPAIP